MAALTETKTAVVVLDVPLYVKKFTVTSAAAGGTIAHGGPGTPFLVVPINTTANPTGADVSVTARDATNITMDFEDDGNETWEVFAFWANVGTGGIS